MKKRAIKNKKYVLPGSNAITYMLNHFSVGDTVTIKDGSYMMNDYGNHVSGAYFEKAGQFELLTIIEINKNFPTDYGDIPFLGRHNNCKIQGADGCIYYCSHINMVNYK